MKTLILLVAIHFLCSSLAQAATGKTIDLKPTQSQQMLSTMYGSQKINRYLNTHRNIDIKISCGWVEVGKTRTCDVEAQNQKFFVTFNGTSANRIAKTLEKLGVDYKGHFANQFANLKCKGERNCDLIPLSAIDYWTLN